MKKILLIISLVLISFTSCDRIDYGDLNQNPYAAVDADASALMRGAFARFSSLGYRGWYLNATLYSQYLTQFQYTNEQLYKHYVANWSPYYTQELNSLKTIMDIEKDPLGGDNVNMRAMADIFSVYIWKRMTDTYGDIPYFEALKGAENVAPAFTSQKDIYLDLLTRVKTSRDALDASKYVPDANADIFYEGDVSKWKKFANSLIMGLAIQLSNTSEKATASTAFAEALASGPIEDNADNLVFHPDEAGNFPSPVSLQRAGDYSISKELVESLKGTTGGWGAGYTDPKNVTSNHTRDLRVEQYASGVGANAGNDASPYGYVSNTGTGEALNDRYLEASADHILMSAAYTYLNRAEASLSSVFNTGENTNDMLTNGIISSFEAAGLSNADGSAQAAIRVADAATAPNGIAQVIGEEKWFALFPDGYSAWAEQRRTGFPALHPAPEAINGGVIPHRMLYPDTARRVNEAHWQEAVNNGLVPAEDKNTSTIWWER